MTRRDALRLLGEAVSLALLAFGSAGCGSGGSGTAGNNGGADSMADDAELNNRLQQVRSLLDDAESKRVGIADPAVSAQLAAQIAIGGAVLVIAERLSHLTDRVGDMNETVSSRLHSTNSSLDSISDRIYYATYLADAGDTAPAKFIESGDVPA